LAYISKILNRTFFRWPGQAQVDAPALDITTDRGMNLILSAQSSHPLLYRPQQPGQNGFLWLGLTG
jgi:hypothetical protein